MADLRKRPPWTVLVLPGGTEIGLEINRALRDLKEVRLISGGDRSLSAAEYRFSDHIVVPHISAPDCIFEINSAIADYRIDAIFPAHDDVLVALASAAHLIDAPVITSPLETCRICRSKLLTYKTLSPVVSVPTVYGDTSRPIFPVFVKPDRGQGSQRARQVRSLQDLHNVLAAEDDLIVMEFLPGEEFTVDCFTDRKVGLVYHNARSRLRTRAGISMQSRVVRDSRLSEMASRINDAMQFHGAWFFQAKFDAEGNPKLLEIAPRVSGTMALSRVLGVNFPLLSLFEAAGHSITINAFDDDLEICRSLDNHYAYKHPYSAVYIDLDDTLITRHGINTRLLRFVYQCVNRRLPIKLLTRHKDDLSATLARYRLQHVFDQVIHLTDGSPKGSAISEGDAILIDDSFSERLAASQDPRIRTFDANAVECLIDDRA